MIALVLARIPPPLLFVATFLAGLGMSALLPLPPAWPQAEPILRGAGWALIGVGAITAALSVGLFAWVRTTIVPHRRAKSMVVAGPFHLSRNPMYVALTFIYIGASAITFSAWPIALLALPVLVLNTLVIPLEERTMSETFGAEYRAYASRVRRWL